MKSLAIIHGPCRLCHLNLYYSSTVKTGKNLLIHHINAIRFLYYKLLAYDKINSDIKSNNVNETILMPYILCVCVWCVFCWFYFTFFSWCPFPTSFRTLMVALNSFSWPFLPNYLTLNGDSISCWGYLFQLFT